MFRKLIIGVRLKASASKFYGVRDSVVGIAICYGLDCPELKLRWGRDLPAPSRPGIFPRR